MQYLRQEFLRIMDAFSKGASGSWEPGEWLYEAQDADSEVDKFFSL